MKKSLAFALLLSIAAACTPQLTEEPENLPEIGEKKGGTPAEKPYVESAKYGVTYVYDGSVPEIHLSVKKDQWNNLLSLYNANNKTKQYVKCDATYVKGTETSAFADAGLRLRGNTSRRYPGKDGAYHHVHFGLNLRKYVKDDAHELHGARKINLKWFKDDPAYVREVFCYDLFRRDTVWTAVHSEYCRLFLKVEGDSKETYMGVYQMQEPIDTRYLKERKSAFGGSDGNLWKCRYGADLMPTSDSNFGLDTGTDQEWRYECKTEDNDFDAAKAQFKDFLQKSSQRSGADFHDWLADHCDVPLLLKTYAVNVACGMWDDYWNNKNNFYVYFNSTDAESYKFFFIPFDYDNTLGTSSNCGAQSDSGRQDPIHWGTDGNYLIKKILGFNDWLAIYRRELLALASDPELLGPEACAERIKAWQGKISAYVSNDTGEDMTIEDKPASWGNHGEYRIMDPASSDNFFKAKTETINRYCR